MNTIKRTLTIILIALCVSLVSCNKKETNFAYPYTTNPALTWGYAQYLGKEFDIDYNILSLSLFSSGLSVDENGKLVGVGQYLLLDDILLPNTINYLQEGVYNVSKDLENKTIVVGQKTTIDDDVYSMGARIYYFEKDDTHSTTKYIVKGRMTVSIENDIYTINCEFITSDNLTITPKFKGEIIHFDGTKNAENIRLHRSFLNKIRIKTI